jgi:DDE_Tnp_1-associated
MSPSLVELLAELPDPRDARGVRHPLVPILSLAIVATLAGCTSLAAISQFGRDRGPRFAHALGFRRGKTPAPSTLSEVLRALDADGLDALVGRWIAGRHAAGWAVVTLDGKVLGGSQGEAVPATHLLAAYAPQAAAVIGQMRVDTPGAEYRAALRLLGVLPPLAGAVVTADAGIGFRDVCQAIRDRGGEYLVFVKGNHSETHAEITDLFTAAADFSPRHTAAVG